MVFIFFLSSQTPALIIMIKHPSVILFASLVETISVSKHPNEKKIHIIHIFLCVNRRRFPLCIGHIIVCRDCRMRDRFVFYVCMQKKSKLWLRSKKVEKGAIRHHMPYSKCNYIQLLSSDITKYSLISPFSIYTNRNTMCVIYRIAHW